MHKYQCKEVTQKMTSIRSQVWNRVERSIEDKVYQKLRTETEHSGSSTRNRVGNLMWNQNMTLISIRNIICDQIGNSVV